MIETWGKNRRVLRNTDSKAVILQKLAAKFSTTTLDIGTMSTKDLTNILKTDEITPVNRVESRFKKDYISELSRVFPTVKNFEKAPISGLKDLINATNNSTK